VPVGPPVPFASDVKSPSRKKLKKRSTAQLPLLALLPVFAILLLILVWTAVCYLIFQQKTSTSPTILSGAIVSGVIALFTALLMRQCRILYISERVAKEAQAIFRAAAEGSLDAFTILKSVRGHNNQIEDFVFVDINDCGARLIGKPKSKILGKKLCELQPTSRTNGAFEKYVEAVKSGAPLDEEFEVKTVSVKGQWLHHQIVPIGDGVAITTRNISARKNAEFETRNSRAFLQSLIDHLPVLIYARSMRPESFGKMVVWNKTAEIVTGYRTSLILNTPDRKIFPPEMIVLINEFERKMLADPMVVDIPEVPFRRPDGGLRYLRVISVPLFDEMDQLEYILGIAEDITLRRQQELDLRTKQAELAAANDASPLGLFHTGPQGDCTYVNRTYEEMSGLTREQAAGDGWAAAIHPEDRLKVFQNWGRCARSGQPYQDVYRFLHAKGRTVWVSVKTAPILVDGRIEGYVGSVDDITTRRAAEQALSDSEQRLRTIADTLPALVAYIDADEHYRFNNIAYERMYGISRDAIRDRSLRDFLGDTQYQRIAPYVQRVLQGETVTFEQEEQTDDTYRCDEATYIPQRADDGSTVIGFHVMIQDISAKKLEEKRLVQLAQMDSLTGLINRAGFQQRLSDAVAHSQEAGMLMAVMYLDIDHFKQINDTYGHPVGDALLIAVVGRLSRTLRSTDIVARLGGDEFTVIMEKLVKPEDAAMVAAKIVQAMQPSFSLLEGDPVSVSVSLGMAFYQGGNTDSDSLIKQADEMLYAAKQAGRNTYRIAPFFAE
jgi:diguanylate cyclase (GGDEF)-like protein/PAS domain S-box-containing protein